MPEESGRHEQIGVSLAGLDRFVSRCVGYRHEGLDPGTHLGLPGTSVTLVLSLDEPTFVGGISSIDDPPVAFDALLGGLYSRPVQIVYGQRLHGIQLDLTPRGVRSLLGIPASELSETVIDLQTLMGPAALELRERLRELPDWDSRFELLGRTLHRRAAELGGPSSALEGAWGRILTSGGGVRIGELAREVGYSRRQLDQLFRREYGLAPKRLARITRFERSHKLLASDQRMTLARVAACCGYYDQAHMARDWRELAGCSPTSWMAHEELPFIQDEQVL